MVHGDLSVALLRDPDGAPIHFISQILDVTEAVETAGALERQRRHLEAILDSVDVGVAVLDPANGYLVVNRRHQQFIELAHPGGGEGMVGQPGELFTPEGRRLEAAELPSTRAVAGEEFDDLIVEVGADPLTRRALSVSARSIRGPDRRTSGAVLAYYDVTDLVRAVAAKDHFVAAVSHELRTPLTSVLGNLELIQDSAELPASLVDRVRAVERNAVRLRELVADLLEVAQMTDGQLRLDRQPLDLVEIAWEAVDALWPTAALAGISLVVDGDGTPLVAEVDGPRMRQVFDNLLGNAVKYTPRGGSVTVRLGRSESGVEVWVEDTGMGMAPEEVQQVFRRFFRGAQVARRQIPGAGLGLSIVRTIVDAHGGRVEVTSRLGSGSTFHVELPVRP